MAKSKKVTKLKITKTRKNDLLTATLYILVGVMFCVFKASMLNVALTIIGVLFIVQGILSLINSDIVSGVVGLAIGLVVILGGNLFIQIVLLIFGVLLIVKGVLNLLDAAKRKNNLMPMLSACLTLFVGILLIVSHWTVVDWFFIILGIIFIVNGVLAILGKK